MTTLPEHLSHSVDRRLFDAIYGLPNTPVGDRYISLVSDLGEGLGWVGIRTGDATFPSGHTASSFASATALSTFYPNAAPRLFTLAALVGASRVHLGHHFPTDVAAGGLIGVGTGTLTVWLLKPPRFL